MPFPHSIKLVTVHTAGMTERPKGRGLSKRCFAKKTVPKYLNLLEELPAERVRDESVIQMLCTQHFFKGTVKLNFRTFICELLGIL